MRREGITGEMWSVRMSTERLLKSLHVHSLMDIVQPAWLFPVFLPLSSPGCTLLPITAHACHPNPVKRSVRSPGLHGEYQTSQAYKGRPFLYPVFQWNKTKNKAQNDAYWLRGQRKASDLNSDLSSIPRHHRVKEDNGPLPLLPSDLHTNDVACTCYIHTYICTSVCNQNE